MCSSMPASTDFIPLGIRIALRNAVGGWGPYTVREIIDLFNSHGFTERDESVPEADGIRRTTVEQFHARIDWHSPEQAQRYLDLVSDVLEFYPPDETGVNSPGHPLWKALKRGNTVAPDGRLRLSSGSPVLETTEIWLADRPRIFFSHVSAHRAEVSELATRVETFDCSCFLAHNQIEPSRKWQDVIESALQSSYFLVAYVTSDFPTSPWTDQEVGWAMGRRIPIIPVSAGLQPYGFFGSYQSLSATGRPPNAVAFGIFRAMAVACFMGKQPLGFPTTDIVATSVVKAFCKSPSYESTRDRFPLIEMVPPPLWTATMLAELESAATENSQVREGVLTARPGRPRVPEAIHELIARVRGG
jgi:hypothetical protein